MQPTSFTCTRCNAPLPVGVTQCTNCGLTFNAPVPPSPMPGYGGGLEAKKGLSTGAIVGIVAAVGCLPVVAIVAAIVFPVLAKVRDKARTESSASNLKQLGLATTQYVQDHNEVYPPTDSMDHFRAALGPYVKDDPEHSIFVQPGVNVPYLLNPRMSNVTLMSVEAPATTVLAQEAVPHQGGLIAILYVDGRVHFEHQDNSGQTE